MRKGFFYGFRADFSWNQWAKNILISRIEKFAGYGIHSSSDIHFSDNRHLWGVNQYIDWVLNIRKLKKVCHYIKIAHTFNDEEYNNNKFPMKSW